MKTSPAFQFYPNDWLSSPRIMLMTPAEEGAYIRLLSICWMNGHLPDDDKELAELSRLGEEWLSGSSEKLRKCFTARRGKLYNERLSKERGKQLKWKQKCRQGGLESGKSRKAKSLQKKNGMKGSSPIDGDKYEVNANKTRTLQSSSSSSNIYTLTQVKEAAILVGISGQQAEVWYHHFAAQGFVFGNSQPITDLSAALVRWRNNQYKFKKGRQNGSNRITGKGTGQLSDNRRGSYAEQESKYGQTIE